MNDRRKPYKVTLQVTYTLSIPVNAFDEDEAVDEIEKWIKKADDYEVVNRSVSKSLNIDELEEDWERTNKKKNNDSRATARIRKL